MASLQLLSSARYVPVRYLLYAIIHGDRAEPREKIRFPDYPRASIMVRTDGLGAVASTLSAIDDAPDITRLLCYSKIIESFDRERAVVPMRYGCRFKELSDIAEFLQRERNRFRALLDEFDGHAEMSARVFLGETPADPSANWSVAYARLGSGPSRPGIQYLTARRQHYACADQAEQSREELRVRVCAMAEGKYSRSIAEFSHREGKSVLQVHFLVPRGGLSAFRRALVPLGAESHGSVEVTGPWAPYNFVCPRTQALTPKVL